MPHFKAHIINHTHWDREWFLTSVYTSRWIAGLIDKIMELAESNPEFHFFLDGQTLVIEDLLQVRPEYLEKVDRLVRRGNLLVGPYYCQPDWRMTSGEALLRNFQYGRQDMQQYGSHIKAGWLVDTFGHISQAPQLHHLFGIEAVYIWRGAPKMTPYFTWRAADGTQIFTINLFGGYRNLYGVTHTPAIAIDRLLAEIHKLAPFYPTADIPLFDGYDLEDNPEDPVQFYQKRQGEMPVEIEIQEDTPASFAQEIRQKNLGLPILTGELNSGKYGAVFPGTLSTRVYLKRMARDCEQLLYQVCEPLGVLARMKGRPYPAERYEAWSRALLQNAVHDCICGVSIDLVHEKAELSYREIFEALTADLQASLAVILGSFAPGTYAVSTNPFPGEAWQTAGNRLYHIETKGIGVWKTAEWYPIRDPARPAGSFTWKNEHYEARVLPNGTVQVGEIRLGALLVYEEQGDAYSEERGLFLGRLHPEGPLLVEQESERHCVLRLDCSGSWDRCQISATVRLTLDPSPLIRWQVALDGSGTDYRVEMAFETGLHGRAQAGMPFDIVSRPAADPDLLPRKLDERLEGVLLGQRELEETRTFPFQEFVTLRDDSTSVSVFAQGLHAYQVSEEGRLTMPLKRAVEWLTKADLEHRVGDAGPFFYVPEARGERRILHNLAVLIGETAKEEQILALNAGFQNPPLLVEMQSGGTINEWTFFQESLPLSSLQISGGQILARLYNPAGIAHPLSQAYLQTDVFGNPVVGVDAVPAKTILTLSLGRPETPVQEAIPGYSKLLSPPAWHVGPDHGSPDPAILSQLKGKIADLERQLADVSERLAQASGDERYFLQHQVYVLEREMFEYRLSVRLNEMKLGVHGQITHAYLDEPDEEIAVIGVQLNKLRIKRRIYDYVIQALAARRE